MIEMRSEDGLDILFRPRHSSADKDLASDHDVRLASRPLDVATRLDPGKSRHADFY